MDKIYKYTSLDSAIKIIKSELVLLNKPSKFNDPFDCSFGLDADDERRSFELLFNYCAVQMVFELVNNNDLKLTKAQQNLFLFIKGEFNLIKKLLNKYPYYKEVPMINDLIKKVIKSNPQIKVNLDEYYKEFKEKMLNKIDEFKGKVLISCFSKRNDSTLMWSHYADSHRGICLEYNMPSNDNYKEVEYTNKRPQMRLFNLISAFLGHKMIGKELNAYEYKYTNDILKPFFVKSLDWKYEEEVRCIYTEGDYKNTDIKYDGDNYFVRLGDIKKIYIGCKAIGHKVDEIIELASHRKIPVIFMKESIDEFKIIPDKNHIHVPSKVKQEERNGLLRLIEEINKSIESKSYLAAFVLSLNIPSLCGSKLYPEYEEKEQYIKWANEWFSQYEKSPDDKWKMPYPSAELLYDLMNKFKTNGTFNINKKYDEFFLDKFILRYEGKKPFGLYSGEASVGGRLDNQNYSSLTINIRDFCWKLTALGNKFYEDYKDLFTEEDMITLEDYDKRMDEYHEYLVINEHLLK